MNGQSRLVPGSARFGDYLHRGSALAPTPLVVISRDTRIRIVVGVLLGLLPTAAGAQPVGAPLAIVVRDASGGAIPGVTVQVVNEQTGASAETITDQQGAADAGPVSPGRYRVESKLDGFDTAVGQVVVEAGQRATVELTLNPSRLSESVIVTARRVEEAAQEVPIPLSVVSGELVASAGAFNVSRLQQLVPTVQFFSTNPRNSSINIRGLGAPFGLTNDGIDPGVGLYVDGTFFARPAAATLDFLDVEQIEVLRGPQGTLFGKNTTAGAISVTTRRPAFVPESDVELNLGNLDFVQAKASIGGPLTSTLAGRISFSGTTRQGAFTDLAHGGYLNGMNNLGLRGQLLFAPSSKTAVILSADNNRQRVKGHVQVVAGVAPTLRAANRQYAQITADLGYTAPSLNAFDRVTDTDTPHQSYQDLGGATLTIERTMGPGRLTAITAWRYWNWDPSNDRDFLGLPVTTISANPSRQEQWTQEVRYAGAVSPSLGFVVGAFAFKQSIASTGKQEQGAAAARFLLAPSALAATPGLLDGYGQTSDIRSTGFSAAMFGQLEWSITDRLRLLPGLRLNYDDKFVDFNSEVYGGLQTTDPALIALQRSILAPQAYQAGADDTNVSGQLTAAYQVSASVNAFATYATSYKPIGLNLSGVPTDALGNPALEVAVVQPEDTRHIEAGVKTEPYPGVTANLAVFRTDVHDYQANVVNAQVGVLRGYLANAEQVRVTGAEFDGTARIGRNVSVYTSAAYSDGVYVSFPDAPPPLEETGGPQAKDISGSPLPGMSKWAVSLGGEYTRPAHVAGQSGELFGGVDGSYRSSFSSSASYSQYLIVDGYALLNARVGFRWADGWSLSVWSRNLLDRNYYDLLSAAPGGSGLYVGVPGDPRTIGVTLRMSLRGN